MGAEHMSVYSDSQTDWLCTYIDCFRNFNVKLEYYTVGKKDTHTM